MEQGTGKTRTTLELVKMRLDKGRVDCVLWLCPCSVKNNLREDIIYHCGEMPENIIIRGIESLSSSDKLYMQLLRLVETHSVYLIVDESNLVKNKRAIRTSRIIVLSKQCKYKIILNGTPVSRNEADMFAQWYVLDWRILGYQSFFSFAANHLEYKEIRMPTGKVRTNQIINVLNVDYLTEKIAPYTYQILKSECLELPAKHYCRDNFFLTKRQQALYTEVKYRYLECVDEFQNETIYKLFSALQHIVSGNNVLSEPEERMRTEPIFENYIDNPRIQELQRLIERNIEDEKCIIFAKYQSEINDICKLLSALGKTYRMFTGKVNQRQRQENRLAFMQDVQFLVANKMCGAYGLNLQFCRNIIYYSNDFDLATRMQSEDRIHRIGQEQEVYIYDIYCPQTIDEFIINCLDKKENMVDKFKSEIDKWKDADIMEIETEKMRAEAENIRREYIEGRISYDDAKIKLKPFKKLFDALSAEKAKKYNIARPQKLSIDMYLKMHGLAKVHYEEPKRKAGIINISYTEEMKIAAIKQYLKDHDEVKHIILFYPGKSFSPLDIENAEFVTFEETILYKFFYPLLEKIDNSYLLVYDECMRLKKRNDLHYNCMHHYSNQTKHKLVFEFFPYIDEPNDYMILMDLVDAGKYQGKWRYTGKYTKQGFDYSLFDEIPVSVNPQTFLLSKIDVEITGKDKNKYAEKKQSLFDNLGNKEPDTIPSALSVFVGNMKAKSLDDTQIYIARNKRFKKSNVATFAEYPKDEKYSIIDFPLRQLVFNDFVKSSGAKEFAFLHTGLPVDKYFYDRYAKFFEEVKEFYAQANLYEGKRAECVKTQN